MASAVGAELTLWRAVVWRALADARGVGAEMEHCPERTIASARAWLEGPGLFEVCELAELDAGRVRALAREQRTEEFRP